MQYECTIEYQPLKVGESLQRIEMVSNDLGSYVYELKLKATPARPEKALYFRAGLGQSHIQVAKFLNFAKQAKADYTCKVGRLSSLCRLYNPALLYFLYQFCLEN